ncbi:hypothetical protein [Sphingopyxis sp. NJF-3]
MADDWQIGDRALCVAVTHPMFEEPSSILRIGAIYTVDRIGRPLIWAEGERALGFSDVSARDPSRGFPETMFRKISPHAPDEFDREVIEQMNGAPVGEPVA